MTLSGPSPTSAEKSTSLLNSKVFCSLILKFYSNLIFSAEYIESDKFFVSAHGMELEWQLCLYPSGKDCEDEEHVSILLELVSRKVDIL